tara:strand:- start:97 stop:528 length:432 start_codon:yes stop_codon:yes gene_type:complete
MFKFFKKKKKENDSSKLDRLLSNTASLFIHAAKIDESYTEKEKEIIKRTLVELGAKTEDIDQIISNAEIKERNSNQILDFTKEIKTSDDSFKTKIIETLWGIIYSNKEEDIYESNLMRRLCGLLYLDNKQMGDIKERVKKKFS